MDRRLHYVDGVPHTEIIFSEEEANIRARLEQVASERSVLGIYGANQQSARYGGIVLMGMPPQIWIDKIVYPAPATEHVVTGDSI